MAEKGVCPEGGEGSGGEGERAKWSEGAVGRRGGGGERGRRREM